MLSRKATRPVMRVVDSLGKQGYMSQSKRLVLLLLLPLAGVAVVYRTAYLIEFVRTDNSITPAQAAYEIRRDPLTIAVSTKASVEGRTWYLSVNSAGKAELTIDTYPTEAQHQFDVSPEQLANLRKCLLEQRFFDLDDEYGDLVVDGGWETITVTAGDETKTVRLRFLMNGVSSDKKKLHDPARAVRVLLVVLGWIDDPVIDDIRPSYEKILEAAQEGG